MDRIDEIVMNSYQEEDQLEEIPEYTRKRNASSNKTPKMSNSRPNDSSYLDKSQSVNKSASKSKLNNLNGSPSQDSYIYWNEELKKLKNSKSESKNTNDANNKNKKIYEKLFDEGNIKNKFKNDIFTKVELSKNKTQDEIEGWKTKLDDPKTINVCNRLYENGIREAKRHENFIKAKQQESEEITSKELVFKPNLMLTESKNKMLLKDKEKMGVNRLLQWKAQKDSRIHQTSKLIEEQSMIENQ